MLATLSSFERVSDVSPGAMLGAIDSIWILLAIALATWIYNWITKKSQQHPGASPEEPHPSVPPAVPPRHAPSSAAGSWEEEIRRLLGEAPPVPPPASPLPRSASPSPPPVLVTPPRPVAAPRPAVRKPALPSAGSLQPVLVEPEAAPARPLAKLEQSRAALQRAGQLHESVAKQLLEIDRQTDWRTQKATARGRKSASADAHAAVALVRNPRSARQAVVASLLLGPPKSLTD